MASFWYDLGLAECWKSIDLASDTIKAMLCSATTVAAKTDTYVDDASGDDAESGELTGVSGYTRGYGQAGRHALSGKAVTNPGANHTMFDATDETWSTLGVGDTITQCIVIKEITADTSSPLIVNLNFTGVPTNGGDFTVSFHTDGIGYVNNA